MTSSERMAQGIDIPVFSGKARQVSQLHRSAVGQAGGVSIDRDGGHPPFAPRPVPLPCRQALFANSCGLGQRSSGEGAQTLYRLHRGRGAAVSFPGSQSANAREGSGA